MTALVAEIGQYHDNSSMVQSILHIPLVASVHIYTASAKTAGFVYISTPPLGRNQHVRKSAEWLVFSSWRAHYERFQHKRPSSEKHWRGGLLAFGNLYYEVSDPCAS